MQERDKNKKEYTRIPTYQELSKVQTCDSYVSLTELLFLNYINGLPLLNPFIAQKWYYEYNLHYTKIYKDNHQSNFKWLTHCGTRMYRQIKV